MLLKIFIPLCFIVLPVLFPLNIAGGKDTNYQFQNDTAADNSPRWNVTGLDQLAWGNVTPEHTRRYWGHLIIAVIVIVYVCAVFFDELRGYIRLRQAYLTSPQHRLRASATTVLVTSIPPKWLSQDALFNLYDVFPGGVRDVWTNRNMDELNEKVKCRDRLALKLESAETELIKKCRKVHLKEVGAAEKKTGKSGKEAIDYPPGLIVDQGAREMALSPGVSSGNPNQVAHTIDQAVYNDTVLEEQEASREGQSQDTSFHPSIARIGRSVIGSMRIPYAGQSNVVSGTRGLVGPESFRSEVPRVGPACRSGRVDTDAESAHSNQPTASPHINGLGNAPGEQSSNNSRQRKGGQDDGIPLTAPGTPPISRQTTQFSEAQETVSIGENNQDCDEGTYPAAYNEKSNQDLGEPLWKKYIKEKDRQTMRLPIFGLGWMPSLWLVGEKVDTIEYCRKEVARLNLEIELDQQQPEKFPLMNSAFVQFNNQAAAHMACQAVSHHLPKQLAPRMVEISPDDVIWENMSIKWWERYIRTFGVLILVSAMVAGWAFPIAFTGLLSQLAYLQDAFHWLRWISVFPTWFISAVQGVLPALFLSILVALLPLILRFLSKAQGVHTGAAVELAVQNYYFAFLFVQLFLVVSISSSFSTIIDNAIDVSSWASMLAQNIPKSSNYFFSYMILQALSVSAGDLLQGSNLVSWFILAPLLDKTARRKWARTMNLSQIQWGTFFPVYTTLGAIGMF